MTPYQAIAQKLEAGEAVILDGGTGTELERLGAPMHTDVWCAEALDSHPDLVQQVHINYINAGADVITTNTYPTTRQVLQAAGLGHKFTEWNVKAVEIAKQARDQAAADRPVAIAGSVSRFANMNYFELETALANYRDQAKLLANNGVDLLLLELLGSRPEGIAPAIEAVLAAGLPVWVSLSCAEDRSSGTVMLGISESEKSADDRIFYCEFDQAVQQIASSGFSALLMMHSELKTTSAAVTIMKENCAEPIGAYPNIGYWAEPNWAFVDTVEPADYVVEAKQWIASGAQIVGGCCGIGPDHIRALREGL
ncbi:MAG: homocysteine S-methyltransferase family protein [Chloroflexota bacterium]